MGTFIPASAPAIPPRKVQERRLPLALAASAAIVLTAAGLGGVAAVRYHSSSAGARVAPAVSSAPVTALTSGAASAASGSLTVHGAGIGSAEPWTIVLVSSQTQADTVHHGIDEANATRGQTGVGLLHSDIALVSTEADASRLRESVAGQNGILVSLGLEEIRISDLRTPVADTAPAAAAPR